MSSDNSGRTNKLTDLARELQRKQQDAGTAMSLGELKQVNYNHRRAAKLEQRMKKLERRDRYR